MTHALNMHTDATIRRHDNGNVTISCGNSGVKLSPGIATMVGQAAGSDPLPIVGGGREAVSPFNMHTDAQTVVTPGPGIITIHGPADGQGDVVVNISGQALTDMQTHGANGGGAAGANPANMHTDVTTSGL